MSRREIAGYVLGFALLLLAVLIAIPLLQGVLIFTGWIGR